MRILQVTNIISHHQLPLARCLESFVGKNNFRFAATQPIMKERKKLGWNSEVNESWVLRVGEKQADRVQFARRWDESDVVICGERILDLMKQRLDHGRLTFYMSERWWKPPVGIGRLLYPPFALAVIRFRKLAKSLYMHFLPIGDYSTQDMSSIAPFTNRMWRWGYFPAVPNPLPACEREVKGLHVLWAGRMLKWKRVDTLIKAFSRLISERPDSFLTLVGEGNERKKIKKLAENLLAPKSYQVLPSMPVSQVLQLMRQHHVYVLSSNGYEGWGAVVNEAMAEGCVVIASETTGAGRTMIRHGKNGLLFPARDWKKLGDLLCIAGSDESQRIRLAQEGQRTIADTWSPAVAAKRFLSVCEAFLSKQNPPIFSDGPMQPAWK